MSSCRFYIFLFVSNGKKRKSIHKLLHEYWTRNNSNTSYRRLEITYKTSPRSLMKKSASHSSFKGSVDSNNATSEERPHETLFPLGCQVNTGQPPSKRCREQINSISTHIRSSVVKPTTHLAPVNSSAGTVRVPQARTVLAGQLRAQRAHLGRNMSCHCLTRSTEGRDFKGASIWHLSASWNSKEKCL